ncbi:hypothetical protein FAIPA1_660006 [Frankia sp. AiPs1]
MPGRPRITDVGYRCSACGANPVATAHGFDSDDESDYPAGAEQRRDQYRRAGRRDRSQSVDPAGVGRRGQLARGTAGDAPAVPGRADVP